MERSHQPGKMTQSDNRELQKSHPVLHLSCTNNCPHDVNVEEGYSQFLPGALHQPNHHELAALQKVAEALETVIVDIIEIYFNINGYLKVGVVNSLVNGGDVLSVGEEVGLVVSPPVY